MSTDIAYVAFVYVDNRHINMTDSNNLITIKIYGIK